MMSLDLQQNTSWTLLINMCEVTSVSFVPPSTEQHQKVKLSVDSLTCVRATRATKTSLMLVSDVFLTRTREQLEWT